MNRKSLGLVFAFIFLAMLATPVMAAPATKIEGVTVTAVVTQAANPGYPRFVSHDTIGHSKGTSVGTVTVNIPGKTPLNGIWNGEFVSMSNWKEDPVVVNIRGKLVWTFTGEGTTGTFVGLVQRKITGFPPSPPTVIPYFEDNVVLHGTGDFQGWTLKVSYAGEPPTDLEGTLIRPK